MKNSDEKKLTIREITTLAMMTGILEAGKAALSFLPNVELVSLLFILFTLYAGRKTYLVALAFVGIECCIYGGGLWVIMYLYVWPVLITVVLLTAKLTAEMKPGARALFYSIVSGAFGLAFGALCSIPYIATSGLPAAVAWWIAGIPWDILHGISNFTICLVLFTPLYYGLHKAMDFLKK